MNENSKEFPAAVSNFRDRNVSSLNSNIGEKSLQSLTMLTQ